MNDIIENENKIDAIQAAILENLPLVECKTEHYFVPDFYVRRCTMPAGTIVVSCIHKQLHPFYILRGDVSVWTEDQGWKRYKGPVPGITEPETRRVLVIHEETVWITFQNTCLTDPDEIEKELIEDHVNPLIPKEIQELAQSLCRGDVRYLEGDE